MMNSFAPWYGFCERPDEDGQALHTTAGDAGGATNHGWTWTTWSGIAGHYGVQPVTPAAFAAQTVDSLRPLTRVVFWNGIQGDFIPAGIDLFWADFHFGSGGGTAVLQRVLGVDPDGVVGWKQTMPALAAVNDHAGLLNRFLAARLAYYDAQGFRLKWPGLYRRATECHALAQTLLEKGQAT